MTRSQSVALVAGGLLLTWASGCGVFGTGPSDEEVVAAIKRSPPSPPTVGPTYLAEIELVQLLERGRYNADGKYWPVRVRVKGGIKIKVTHGLQLGPFSNATEQSAKPLDFVEEAHVTKDDFGAWRVSYAYHPRGPRWRLDGSDMPRLGR